MQDNYMKYSEKYARYWFRYIGHDLKDSTSNRVLTKGEFYNLYPAICNDLAEGSELPKRFKLVPREPFTPIVQQHGKLKYVNNI